MRQAWSRGSRNSGQQARKARDGLDRLEAHLSARRRWFAVVCSSSRGARRTRPEGVAEWCFEWCMRERVGG